MSTKLKVVTAATYPDALVQLDLLLVVLLSVEGVQADAVVHELLPNLYRIREPISPQLQTAASDTHLLLERLALLESERVRLGNDGDNVHHLGELLHDDDINRAERVARRVDEEQAAVDARVLDVTVALRSELLAEVRAVLVLDVLHDRVPARAMRQRDARAWERVWVGQKGQGMEG